MYFLLIGAFFGLLCFLNRDAVGNYIFNVSTNAFTAGRLRWFPPKIAQENRIRLSAVRINGQRLHLFPEELLDRHQVSPEDTLPTEVEYFLGSQRYRLLVRPGDTVSWPPVPFPLGFCTHFEEVHGPNDVSRFLEFAGPRGDFHGTRPLLKWLTDAEGLPLCPSRLLLGTLFGEKTFGQDDPLDVDGL
ncbi:MAG: hypothetical protein ACYCOU_00795 [Sulfobacillus sp.]